MATEVTAKKWGNSMGVIIPKEMVEKEHINEGDTFFIERVREIDISASFGALKGKIKLSGQEFKDMVREGWGT